MESMKKYIVITMLLGIAGYKSQIIAAYSDYRTAEANGISAYSVPESSALVDQNLLQASRNGDVEGVLRALRENANVNAKRRADQGTALHIAKTVEVAEVLIAASGDVDAKDLDQNTPLHRHKNNAPMVRLLLANDADVHAANRRHETPLYGCESLDVIGALLEAKADIGARTISQNTVLHTSIGDQAVRHLILRGAHRLLNAKNSHSATPLLERARVLRPGDVEALVELRADVNTENDKGITPLHCIKSAARAQLLIDSKANLNAEDSSGRTPLDTAHSPEIAQVLRNAGAHFRHRDKDGKPVVNLSLVTAVDPRGENKGGNQRSCLIS